MSDMIQFFGVEIAVSHFIGADTWKRCLCKQKAKTRGFLVIYIPYKAGEHPDPDTTRPSVSLYRCRGRDVVKADGKKVVVATTYCEMDKVDIRELLDKDPTAVINLYESDLNPHFSMKLERVEEGKPVQLAVREILLLIIKAINYSRPPTQDTEGTEEIESDSD